MKKVLMIFIAITIGFIAFAKHHKHLRNRQPGNGIVSVIMHRTPCYGMCPDYSIEINRNGMVTYTAVRFNPDTGIFTKNIGAKAMEIINQFDSYRVDTCKNRYINRVQDLPGLFFTIKYTDSVKQISNAQFGPPYLRLLATKIDKEGKKTDNEGWEKVSK